ncbi:MAG: HAD family hydrolase [Sarcina sp.]
MLNNMKAAIFDLDGTLIDSMGVWIKIDIDYLTQIGQINNVDLIQLKNDINHLSFVGTADYFKTRFNLDDSIEEICKKWHDMAYNEYKNNIKLKDGVFEFLHELKSKDIKIGLATSNSIELATTCLKANNVYDLFDNITITGEVARGKNFPDVYELCAKRLNVDTNDCIVFEDIPQALEGAKKGNFKVVMVFDEVAHKTIDTDADVIEADLYINSFKEILNN